MYIDKLQPFWTEAELRKSEQLKKQGEELQQTLDATPMLSDKWNRTQNEQSEINQAENELREGVRKRYTLSFYKRPNKVFDDVKEIVEATTREEFIEYITAWRGLYNETLKSVPALQNSFWHDKFVENYDNFYEFIEERLHVQRHVIDYYGLSKEKYKGIIDRHVKRFYKEEQPAYLPMMQAPATNALAEASTKSFIADPLTEANKQTVNGITITADPGANLRQLSKSIKLFDALMLKLSVVVPSKATPEQVMKAREMDFSVADYMKVRNLSDAKHARTQLIEGLQFLYSLSLDWQETIYYDHLTGQKLRKPEKKKWHTRILDAIGEDVDKPIKRGNATIKFNPDLVMYLSHDYVMPMPSFLFRISDSQYPYAYLMGRKMALHKNMNIGRPNENRMAVKTLLETIPDIPTYEEVINSNDKHVGKRIREPFEKNLKGLEEGLTWRYLNSRGEPITEEEADTPPYADWLTWIIEFEFTEYPDTTGRREQITQIRSIKEKKKLQEEAKKKTKRG